MHVSSSCNVEAMQGRCQQYCNYPFAYFAARSYTSASNHLLHARLCHHTRDNAYKSVAADMAAGQVAAGDHCRHSTGAIYSNNCQPQLQHLGHAAAAVFNNNCYATVVIQAALGQQACCAQHTQLHGNACLTRPSCHGIRAATCCGTCPSHLLCWHESA